VILATGLPGLTWLKASKKSARKFIFNLSDIWKLLEPLMSQFHDPGPTSKSLAELPHCHSGGGAKASVLYHGMPFEMSWEWERPLVSETPGTRSARPPHQPTIELHFFFPF